MGRLRNITLLTGLGALVGLALASAGAGPFRSTAGPAPGSAAPPIVEVTVDASRSLGDFRHIWIGSDVGYSDRVLTATQRQAMEKARGIGFKYVRMHGCVLGPGIYSVGPDGKAAYAWADFDRRVGAVLEQGMVPVVVLESMPPELAGRKDARDWINPYPPKDEKAYGEWRALVGKIIAHARATWGPRIHEWYFEVWNEPDAPAYFKGTQADYFKMYDYAVAGAVQEDPGIRIGGVAGATDAWCGDFLRHCRSGKNEATGGVGSRVDFFSWHIYAGGEKSPSFPRIGESVARVRAVLAQMKEYANLPLLVTEWGLSSRPAAAHDMPYDAAFRAMAVRVLLDGGVTLAFPYNLGEGPQNVPDGFVGGLALLTKTAVPKPSFRTFELLDAMVGRRIPCDSPAGTVGGMACLAPDGSTVWVALYNVSDTGDLRGYDRDVRIRFQGLDASKWKGSAVKLSSATCDPRAEWSRLGEPLALSADQMKSLLAASAMPRAFPVEWNGQDLRLTLDGPSLLVLRLTRTAKGKAAPARPSQGPPSAMMLDATFKILVGRSSNGALAQKSNWIGGGSFSGFERLVRHQAAR